MTRSAPAGGPEVGKRECSPMRHLPEEPEAPGVSTLGP